ncbi:recombinase family protein [Sporolituus thermophilus]|uniref:Site-specific DNA recombinase n=1 Tax=Sporolituus thermophilus DSM 23256 TaxID=1123285 RepID=A0A1G7JRM6_9FIRM|nr:recombinase family protein [Sporolituus thermophilus]SDF27600.1 site-specific DNA recombinase [Sporolituus thermophilus DSM 23256]
MKKIHIYARVSTDAQAEKGYSIQTQLDACRAKAAELGVTTIVEHVDDGYSGATLDRPGLADLRAAVAEKQVDVIVCYDPDRLSRNHLHQLLLIDEFEQAGVEMVFVTVTYERNAEGKLLYSIRSAVAEFERAKIRERSIRGKRGKALAGKVVMNTHPYGYAYDRGTYVPDEKADTVRRIFKEVISGKSIYEVMKQLNMEKIPSPKGGRWYVATISRILRNPLYTGEVRQFRETKKKINGKWKTERKNEYITVPCEPIVTREEFTAAAQAVARQKQWNRRNTRHEYLLQNIAFCGFCGRRLDIVQRGRGKYYYLCASHRRKAQTGQPHCGARGIAVDILEDAVADRFQRLLDHPQLVREYLADADDDTPERLAELRKAETELLARQQTVMRFFAEGKVDEKLADETLAKIQAQLGQTRQEIAALTTQAGQRKTIEKRVADFMAAVQQASTLREILLTTVKKITVKRTDKNQGRWAETELEICIELW